MDFALLAAFYRAATTWIPRMNPTDLPLDSVVSRLPLALQPKALELASYLYPVARFAGWQVYALAAGLVGTGLWIVAHECGHQAFSTSKSLNNAVGWVLHSALGVPYHSWRISHAKHHAATSHCTRDEVYVPRTRSEKGLPPLDHAKEDLAGGRVDEKVQAELWDALGDSPLGAALGVFGLLVRRSS
jgi:omega-6 fatty acid desaturase (delta-12 desaturase)